LKIKHFACYSSAAAKLYVGPPASQVILWVSSILSIKSLLEYSGYVVLKMSVKPLKPFFEKCCAHSKHNRSWNGTTDVNGCVSKQQQNQRPAFASGMRHKDRPKYWSHWILLFC